MIGYCIIAQLPDPNKTKLLTTLLDFAQRLVNEKWIDHAGPEETTFVLGDVARNFPVAGYEVGRALGELAAYTELIIPRWTPVRSRY